MYIIFLLVSFLASIAGAICGIGGGVIIKPVLDALGVMSVSSISFLSGCTVLTMSAVSVYKLFRNKSGSIELRMGTALAAGAALGGIIGKKLFQYAFVYFPNENMVGALQAAVLIAVTLLTLIYTIKKSKIRTKKITLLSAGAGIGVLLGVLSAFLGIGGGPINLMVLSYFFSMDIKKAAANSLYIILFSQLTSVGVTILQQSIPQFSMMSLVCMVGGGLLGGTVGSRINKRIDAQNVNRLFIGLMILIICINIYNVVKFVS